MKKILKGVGLGALLLLIAFQLSPTGVIAEGEKSDIRLEPPAYGFSDIGSFVNNLARFIFILAVVLVFIYFLWGGIRWITSGGDKAQTEAARNVLTAALLGFAVIALAYALVRLIGSFFGVDIFGGFNIPTPPPTGNFSCVLLGEAVETETQCKAGCKAEGQQCRPSQDSPGRWLCCTPVEEE